MTVPKRSRAPRFPVNHAGPGIPGGPGQTPADRLPVHPRPFGAVDSAPIVEALREARAELADLAAWLRK